MRKIFISSGHGLPSDPGAVSGKYVEAELTVEVRNMIVCELAVMGVLAITDPVQNPLQATLNYIKGKFGAKDILFDIHFNAFNGTAQGTEVIIPKVNTQFERDLARDIVNVLVSAGYKSRGVKTEDKTARKTLGWMRPLAENILLEFCFLDNKGDMNLYESKKQEIAAGIAKVLYNYSKI